jgi:hypothetical protein
MKEIIVVSIFACSAWLTGCSTVPQSKALAESERQITGWRDVIVAIPQSEPVINLVATQTSVITTPSTNSTGILAGALTAGLVSAVIEGVHVKQAESAITPIRDALKDYDFDKKALNAIRQANDRVYWLNVKTVTFTKDGTNENFAKLMDASGASQMMYDYLYYGFSSDFKALYIGLNAAILKRKPSSAPTESASERMADKNDLYFNKLIFEEKLAGATDDVSVNAKRWAENNSALARSALDKGIDQIARNLVIDLYKAPPTP